ncbi:phage baseplate assembly protein V [Microbacterium cremeum]|uniref:phage baseplate assembly protein V n=1 Tax=Microbacterium cremeum TaxID=2782169 RepID=UPI00188901F1|nr:phage baseplate assembly protein V [Microbacterium cremeum]
MSLPVVLPAPAPAQMPGVRLRVAGAEVDPVGVGMLTTVRVRREASAPAVCAVTFDDPAGAAELERLLAPGVDVEVGVDGFAEPLFTGDVVVLERAFRPDGTMLLTARCQDAAHRLRADSRMRAFVDVSVAELARDLVAPAGLDVQAPDEGPRMPRLLQDGRTALDLLTHATRRAGLWWQIDAAGSTLRLFDRAGTGREATAAYGRDLVEAVVTTSALAHRSGWRVLGWDPVTGEVAGGSADAAVDDAEAREGVLGGSLTAGVDHADALARGLAADEEAASRGIRAVVEGDPALAPGTVLTVAGLTPDASASFLLLAADHVIDTVGGYTCTVSSHPPEHLQLRSVAGRPWSRSEAAVTVGEVLRIDDPEGRGRVRVTLPAYDGLESEWLPVLALGAGESKGLALQPDVGDHVVVAHDAWDAGRGVVLGGLRSSDGGEPGVGVVDGAVGVYGLRLPTGQSLRLSADGDAVAAANSGGSRVELTEDGIVVHAAGDLVVEAPGRTLTLRAKRIEMEQA